MKHVVVGTAGHIDHGKTELVKALTGVDTDRLKEERERGITTDLGFAPLVLGSGLTIGFVDVPGHERFIKNMLAGVWGIDLVLLVIAADESIKSQTREHFEICSLLRVPRGLVALTKIDLVEPELVELGTLEIREFTQGSFLSEAPIVPVSSRTGEGLERLKDAIALGAGSIDPGRPSSLLRLPVDRSFSAKGFGTVVTGTLVSGEISEGDEVSVYPQGASCRVRGLQVHGAVVKQARAGQRTAVNLQGIDTTSASRGHVVARPGEMRSSSLMDVKLKLLATAPGPLKDLARVRFHQGTCELLARVKLLGEGAGAAPRQLDPGGETFAQIRLERPGLCLPSDRFVIRRYSPTVTIGGGVVLDTHPVKHKGPAGRDLIERLSRLEAADALQALRVYLEGEPGGAALTELAVRSGRTAAEVEDLLRPLAKDGSVFISSEGRPATVIGREAAVALEARVTETLGRYHRSNPLREGMPREELREQALKTVAPETARLVMERLARQGAVKAQKDWVSLAGHAVTLSEEDSGMMRVLEDAFLRDGLNPPVLEDLVRSGGLDAKKAERVMRLMLSMGTLVKVGDGRFFHSQVIEKLKRRLWDLLPSRRVIDIGTFKELTGTSRKNAIPLLEHLDAMKVTRRVGSDREILPPSGG